MQPSILFSSEPTESFEKELKSILQDIGYVVSSPATITEGTNLNLVLLFSKNQIGQVESSLKSKHISSKDLPYLFLNPLTTPHERPDAGIWLIEEHALAMNVAYKIEKIIGLPELSEDEVDVSYAAPLSHLDDTTLAEFQLKLEALNVRVSEESHKRETTEENERALRDSLMKVSLEIERLQFQVEEKENALSRERVQKEEIRHLAEKLLEATR